MRDIKARLVFGGTIALGDLDSLSPTLQWEPPTHGLPNRYYVQAYKVEVVSEKILNVDTDVVKVTKVPQIIYVERPEAHIPPEILEPRTQYVFVVTAENCTAGDSKRPRRLNVQTTCAMVQNRSLVLKTPDL